MSKPLYGERFEYSVVNDLLTTELTPLLTKTVLFDLKSISLLSQRLSGGIIGAAGDGNEPMATVGATLDHGVCLLFKMTVLRHLRQCQSLCMVKGSNIQL